MNLGLILSFIGTSIILTLMPGPDNIFVLTESITKGQRDGVLISIGLSLGVLVHTVAAATGLSIIIKESAFAFSIIKYFGAVYLFYLAYKTFKEKKYELSFGIDSTVKNTSFFKLIKKGFLMNVLNPKVSLFFIAFLPQFITVNGISITVQMFILGAIFMLQALFIFSLVSFLSSKLTKYVTNTKFWKITKWSKISVLFILALALVLSDK